MEKQGMKLLKKGAEACLYKDSYLGMPVIRKERVPKPYRHPTLDSQIRASRTVLEGRLLSDARRAGVPTPVVFQIDPAASLLMMEYIKGTVLRDLLNRENGARIGDIFGRLGTSVARLHNGEIIHGDLTTSNVIVDEDHLTLIDFGLGDYSSELEARGVDLHLLLRTLESSHSKIVEKCWLPFLEGYREAFSASSKQVVEKVREIRRRGRYVEERKQK